MDADSGYDRGVVSQAAWRRAHGFSDADAPTPNEFALRMLYEKGVITPELTETFLATFAPEVMNEVREQAVAASQTGLTPEQDQMIMEAATGTPATPPAEAPPAEGQEQ
jgi:hypothetical protein